MQTCISPKSSLLIVTSRWECWHIYLLWVLEGEGLKTPSTMHLTSHLTTSEFIYTCNMCKCIIQTCKTTLIYLCFRRKEKRNAGKEPGSSGSGVLREIILRADKLLIESHCSKSQCKSHCNKSLLQGTCKNYPVLINVLTVS